MLSVWTQAFISLHLPSGASDNGHLFVRLWRSAKARPFGQGWGQDSISLPGISRTDLSMRDLGSAFSPCMSCTSDLQMHGWVPPGFGLQQEPCLGYETCNLIPGKWLKLISFSAEQDFWTEKWIQSWRKQEGGLLYLLLVKYPLLLRAGDCLTIFSELLSEYGSCRGRGRMLNPSEFMIHWTVGSCWFLFCPSEAQSLPLQLWFSNRVLFCSLRLVCLWVQN